MKTWKIFFEGNEQIDSDKRLNINAPLIRAVSGCLKRNSVIKKLSLEGLTLTADSVQTITTVITTTAPPQQELNKQNLLLTRWCLRSRPSLATVR